MVKIGVLVPSVATENERIEIGIKLTQDSSNLLQYIDDNTPDDKFREWEIKSTAKLVYDRLCLSPRYLTWDEVRGNMKQFKQLDEAIKYLKQHKYIKEGYIEINADGINLQSD